MKVQDQMQREVAFSYPPRRIVSLVPSQSEFLASMEIGPRLVGVTKFCVHPASLRSEAQIVGGTKQFHIDKVLALQPDLVIGNMEENSREQIEELARQVPVYMSKIESVEDAFDMMSAVGKCCDLQKASEAFVQKLRNYWGQIIPLSEPKTVAYLIWREPWMAAGPSTYIHDVLAKLGFQNVFHEHTDSRYPAFSLEVLSGLKPEEVLLSSEPYPFKDKDLAELQKILPESTIRLVDGEMFSWYGSRMEQAVGYFEQLLTHIQK